MSDAKTFTLADLKAKSSKEGAYLLIDGKVYDATEFLPDHPGGDELILKETGKDATAAFEEVGHSYDAQETLKNFYIGEYKP